MLGSATEAEDMVQEAYLRWVGRSDGQVESVRAYLVTIVTRLCIDQLASARVRRVAYAGPWLPEPIMAEQPSAVEQADSLTMAFLVLLEELTPPERAAFLLHDVFGYPFDEVARSVGPLRHHVPPAGVPGPAPHRPTPSALRSPTLGTARS